MDDLRASLESAFESIDDEPATPAESVAEPVETAPAEETAAEREARERDELGRFKAKDKNEAGPEPALSSEAPKLERPKSWKKDRDAEWQAIVAANPTAAEYILEREKQFTDGITAVQSDAQVGKTFKEVVEPYRGRLEQMGGMERGLQRMFHIDNVLSYGQPHEKQAMLVAIAQAVGVDLTQPVQMPDPSMVPVLSKVQQLEQQLAAQQMAAQRAEQARIMQELEQAQSWPHFNEVAEDIATLIERGVVTDLQSGYEKALRLNDNVWQRVQADKARESAEADRKRAADALARSRAAAVSPRSSTPTAVAASPNAGDLRSQIAASFEAHAGRI